MNKTQYSFLRHGTTKHNTLGIYSGSSNPSLDKVGVEQVTMFAQTIRDEVFDVFLFGYMQRVAQTAEIVLQHLNQSPKQMIQMEDIIEIDFGLFEQLSYQQIEKKHPEEWRQYMNDWKNYTFPQGESVQKFYDHCKNSIKNISREFQGEKIMIVGHKGYILACASALYNEGLDGMYTRDIKHAETLKITI